MTSIWINGFNFFNFRINFKNVSLHDSEETFDWIVEPENRMAKVSTFEKLHYLHLKYYRRGTSSLLTLKESAGTYFGAYAFKSFSPFIGIINNMSYLAAGGIYDFEIERGINPAGIKMVTDKIGPQVLTMEHLLVGFQIFFIALIISSVIFLIESTFKIPQNIIPRVKSCLRRKLNELLKPKQQKILASINVRKNQRKANKEKNRRFL